MSDEQQMKCYYASGITPSEAAQRAEAESSLAPAVGSEAALRDVLAERKRQEAKWGEQNHDPFTYLTILAEEMGELSQAALHHRFGGPAASKLREEAIHTAAVALAIVECLDRAKWSWPQNNPDQRPGESPKTL